MVKERGWGGGKVGKENSKTTNMAPGTALLISQADLYLLHSLLLCLDLPPLSQVSHSRGDPNPTSSQLVGIASSLLGLKSFAGSSSGQGRFTQRSLLFSRGSGARLGGGGLRPLKPSGEFVGAQG